MSLVSKWHDAGVVVRELVTPEGSVWVRVRRPTSGEVIEAGMSGALEPTAGKRRAKDANDGAKAAAVIEQMVQVCTLGIGETADSIEPVTVVADESGKPRVGTRAVPLYVIPQAVVAAIGSLAFELFSPEATRAKLAAFPAG